MTLFLLLCLAADPTVAVPTESPVYVPVPVKVVGGTATADALFEVTPQPAWERDTGDGYEFTGPPGNYSITVTYGDIVNGKLKLKKIRATTKIVGKAPPGPDPIPPPSDPLVKALTEAFSKETDPNKDATKAVFVGFYSGAASLVESQDANGVYRFPTYGKLNEALQADATARGMAGKLPNVRKVTTAHLDSVLPTKNAAEQPIGTAERARTASEFLKLAKALEAVQ